MTKKTFTVAWLPNLDSIPVTKDGTARSINNKEIINLGGRIIATSLPINDADNYVKCLVYGTVGNGIGGEYFKGVAG